MYIKQMKELTSCPGNVVGTDDVLTDYIYNEYNTPVMTAKVTCCEYPSVANIPYIWRDILAPSMSLLQLVNTGRYRYLLLEEISTYTYLVLFYLKAYKDTF